tara:strand:+ start:100 stop:285 length:186 start_codon:yes stop_codon:yes gene_type:complete
MNNLLHSEALRISHSIDAISKVEQIVPHFNWIKRLEELCAEVMGVQEVTQLLRLQLTDIEL